MKSYQQAIDYLYASLPVFQRVGAVAYKGDLTNTLALCEALGHPQKKFKSVHVAGTNGKGSSSHMLAAVLQSNGYKTGLYTSPHLKEFTERIKINGAEVSKEFVVDFVNRMTPVLEKVKPSFFETTVAMAFDYFDQEKVDIAVIEVGLGGRLDSTNVITPEITLITNISWDHMDLLGDTLERIATEKAGIIKPNIPVVISERQKEVENVFLKKALNEKSPIEFAEDRFEVSRLEDGQFVVNGVAYQLDLQGDYQQKNIAGILATLDGLKKKGFNISDKGILEGLSRTIQLTGLKGRWQKLGDKPLIICDTGHNESGIREVLRQVARQKFEKLHIVWGMVGDKDVSKVLSQLPKEANYYFCAAKIPRAMPVLDLQEKMKGYGLTGKVIEDVNEAIAEAKRNAAPEDMIFIGGSTFVVAEIDNL
ncbi:MAG TPA: folylpolyglutamate synthase/dihydrofolate synthase family protein [Cyclobacteriaceae bacterium]|jgi:dihydrofolate synthase/folylpolyglutamate synthase|nr:folylpolyglutamate synthase/dihydrofolate synthase family protein [Cyclobacteriaceae bacterium]